MRPAAAHRPFGLDPHRERWTSDLMAASIASPCSVPARTSKGRGAAMPLYQQIYTQLRDEIISGARPLGSLVPTEHEIVAHYKGSRTTANLALNKLAEQKFVACKRKVGTRVISRSTMQPLIANTSNATEPLSVIDRETRVTVIKIVTASAGGLAATLLQVELGTWLLRIDRVVGWTVHRPASRWHKFPRRLARRCL